MSKFRTNFHNTRLGKKQRGFFLNMTDLGVALGLVALVGATIVYPMMRNANEDQIASRITSGYMIIQRAAQDAYPNGTYTGLSWDKIEDHLPDNYSQTAPNGQKWNVNAASSGYEMAIALAFSSDRILEKVKSRLNTDSVTSSSSTLTLTTR